jgi:hypothetical protein
VVEQHGRHQAEAVQGAYAAFLAEPELPQEHRDAGRDQAHGEQRDGFGRVVVVQGYHRARPVGEADPILAMRP